MPKNALSDYFRLYFEQTRTQAEAQAWLKRYRSDYEVIEELKAGRRELTTELMLNIWNAQHFGSASIYQGVVPKAEIPAALPLLGQVTRLVISSPTPETLLEAYALLEQGVAQGVISSKPWAMTHRLLSTSNPYRYTAVVADAMCKKLQGWLTREYGFVLPDSDNWAVKDSAVRAFLVQQGLSDNDPFILNTFAWLLAKNYIDGSAVQEVAQLSAKTDATPAKPFPALNTIYYGPPGTGKTFLVHEILRRNFVTAVADLPQEQWEEGLVQEAVWRDVIAAALDDAGGKATVPELFKHPLVEAKFRCKPGQKIKQSLWLRLQVYSPADSRTIKYTKRLEPALFDKLDDGKSSWILLPGWEERSPEAAELLHKYRSGKPRQAAEDIRRYECITFHQSYSYEDFVEGIRPVLDTDEEGGDLAYTVRPGLFKIMCDKARSDPANDYALLIDEINRGNISKIFGELIALIEDSKRDNISGKSNGEAMQVDLPYSGNGGKKFSVPDNLYIIGTMNTADRSLAFMDSALRRRFSFVRVDPSPSALPNKLVEGVNLETLLTAINERIEVLYDREHVIGHSYFWKVKSLADLRQVFENQLLPLLEEYFFEDWEKIRLALVLPDQENSDGLSLIYRKDLSGIFRGEAAEFADNDHWCFNYEALDQAVTYRAMYSEREES